MFPHGFVVSLHYFLLADKEVGGVLQVEVGLTLFGAEWSEKKKKFVDFNSVK
jgi:hypothetical protein